MTIRLLPILAILAAAPVTGFCLDDKPAAPAAAPAEKRKLVVHRPETKGAKYDYTSKGSQTRTMDFHADDDVQPAGSQNLEVTLNGLFEVTEVSPKAGNVTGYTVTIKKMTLSDGGGRDEGLKPSTVVTAKVADFKSTFSINGAVVKDTMAEALTLALPFHYGVDEKVDEDTFEPKEPLAKGEKWKPDVAKVAALMKKYSGVELDTVKSTAEARYKGTATVHGMEADVIVASETYFHAKLPGLPEGSKLIKWNTSHDITFSLDRDGKTSAALDRRAIVEEHARYTAKSGGKDYDVEIKSHSESYQTSKPVK